MGNSKNKTRNNNNHRHVYARRKPLQKYTGEKNDEIIKDTSTLTPCTIDGSRIINMGKLSEYLGDIGRHAKSCTGTIVLIGEKRQGLASIIGSKCNQCDHTISFDTSKKVKGPRGINRWECNLAAVWGQMGTGGGHTSITNTMSVLGIPVMAKKSFTQTQSDIGEWWHARLNASMIEAGKLEKQLAEEHGDYHQGVPAVTVILDAGWSKRSHKHSYNAKSGVGVIIGQRTKKLLFIGVRNKFCAACSQGIAQDKHQCYKNWDESSSEMESDILLQGFLEAEATHGIRYITFVGDGDSSVYPTLLSQVRVWGRDIKKMECANHACKCYRSSLEKLASENPGYRGKGGLTQKMRKRLTSAARCAIKMRSQESNRAAAIKLLAKDLINGPLHCFGHHSKCSADFCRTVQNKQQQQSASSAEVPDPEDEYSLDEPIASKLYIPAKPIHKT